MAPTNADLPKRIIYDGFFDYSLGGLLLAKASSGTLLLQWRIPIRRQNVLESISS
jgi:hypothetical protein